MNLVTRDLAPNSSAAYSPGQERFCLCRAWVACAALFLCLFTGGAKAGDSPLALLTNAQQVIDLGMDGARRNPYPVKLRGVITYVAVTHRDWIFVQDETAGLLVTYES